ncbi:MAG: hypothetical protein GKR89_20345 [Candidatus Latescibacteria bacterium]|nr:hypothetical protein [Candidatus Latescibacterota bacterium]
MSVHTLFWFDVEDYITPSSDEAFKGLLEIFEAQQVQATWKLVGEKARVLKQRGRGDIIALAQRQDIGYHTDFHSLHPVLAEYLETMGWEDGIAELLRRESPGYQDLKRICGPASTFGQAGGSWAPHIYPAMRQWDIPLFMDEAGHVGLDEGPFWYCGVLHINRLGPNFTRMEFSRGENGLAKGCADFDTLHTRLGRKGGLASIYYHPCEFSTTEFWDGANFRHGANPPPDQWRPAQERSSEEMRQGLDLFARYLAHVKNRPGVDIISGRQVINLLPDRTQTRPISPAELLAALAFADDQISYAQVDGGFLAPAELFDLTTALLAGIAQPLPRTTPYGPTQRRASTLPVGAKISAQDLLQACHDAQAFIATHQRLPNSIWLGVEELSPADFFLACVELVKSSNLKNTDITTAGPISLRPGTLALEHHIHADSWGWVIFPPGFQGHNLIELGRLQAWTLKPATLVD